MMVAWRFLGVFLGLLVVGLLASSVLAQGNTELDVKVNLPVRPAVATKAASLDNRSQAFQAKILTEVERRLGVLNGVLLRVSNSSVLTAELKATLIAQIQEAINALNGMKTGSVVATDKTALRSQSRAAIAEYGEYALLVPKVQLVLGASNQLAVASKMASVSARLKASVDSAKVAGANVEGLEKSLDEANGKIANAARLAQGVIDSVLPLKSGGSSKTVLQTGRKNFQTALTDLQSARKSLEMVFRGLKGLGGSATTSATLK